MIMQLSELPKSKLTIATSPFVMTESHSVLTQRAFFWGGGHKSTAKSCNLAQR